jgi:hypothetical protein
MAASTLKVIAGTARGHGSHGKNSAEVSGH